jgi:hypothetical protein
VSKPGTVSATVGVLGSVGSLTLLAMASERILLPPFICAAMVTTSENITWRCDLTGRV